MFSDPAVNLARLGLVDGMRVVDIGAGSGFYTIEAARRVGGNGRVYAVDVQKGILDRIRLGGAHVGLRNIEVVWGDAEKIGGTKLRDAIADRVILSNVLFQTEKPGDLSLEIKRIMKPGGKLLVVDWSDRSPIGPKQTFPAKQAETLFEKAGFMLEESFGAGEHHYGLVFERRDRPSKKNE